MVVISSGSYAQGGTDWFGAEGDHDWVSVKRPGLTDQIESEVYIGVSGKHQQEGYDWRGCWVQVAMGAMRNYGQTKFLQVPSYPQRLAAILSHSAPWLGGCPALDAAHACLPLAGQAAWALDLQEQMGGRLDVVLHNPVRPSLPLPLSSVCC